MMRKTFPEEFAKQLISVQPMSPDAISTLYKHAKTNEELENDGYRPVSSLGLMYVKNVSATPD